MRTEIGMIGHLVSMFTVRPIDDEAARRRCTLSPRMMHVREGGRKGERGCEVICVSSMFGGKITSEVWV